MKGEKAIKNEGLDVDLEGLWVNNTIFFPISEAAFAYCSSISQEALERKIEKYLPGKELNLPHKLLMPLNKRNQYIGLSGRNILSAKIRSRSSDKEYTITIGGATIRHIKDLADIYFEGGTAFTEKKLRKGNHWTSGERGLKSERNFLDLLKNKDNYTNPIKIADFTHYIALITANKIKKEDKFYASYGLSKNSPYQIALPYDFDLNPKIALQACIMRYIDKKSTKEVNSFLMRSIDSVITPIFKEGIGEGIVHKGSLIRGKKFTHYTWAVIQAIELYFDKKGYTFSRYTPEFTNTKFETHAIRFDAGDFSVSILYDENFLMPYLLYHDYDPKGGLEGIRELGKRDPRKMINWSRDLHKQRGPIRRYTEKDYWNNREALCTIYEPKREILEIASRLSGKIGFGISAWRLKGRYIDAFKAYKKTKS